MTETKPPPSPRSTAELGVRKIFRELFPRAVLRPTDNFFDLGGTSMDALRLVEMIHETFGVQVPLVTIFDCETPEAIAAAVVSDAPVPTTSLVPIQPHGD